MLLKILGVILIIIGGLMALSVLFPLIGSVLGFPGAAAEAGSCDRDSLFRLQAGQP